MAKSIYRLKGRGDSPMVIITAMREVGYCEKSEEAYAADPTVIKRPADGIGMDNITKYGHEMHRIFPGTMDFPAPWCGAFVCWCFVEAYGKEAAERMLHGFDDYTPEMAHNFKAAGRYKLRDPKPGDVVFFRNRQRICHTGIVIEAEGGKLRTVEGNTSARKGLDGNGGTVAEKLYSLPYEWIDGYGEPDWSKQN